MYIYLSTFPLLILSLTVSAKKVLIASASIIEFLNTLLYTANKWSNSLFKNLALYASISLSVIVSLIPPITFTLSIDVNCSILFLIISEKPNIN